MKKKKVFIFLGVLVGILAIGVVAVVPLTPWMDRWGTTDTEI